MTTEKAKQAVTRCRQKNYDQVTITFPKGQRAVVKAFAESHGMSMNEFIRQAIAQAMGCDSRTDHD